MAKATIQAKLPFPAERVWNVMTDLTRWDWRSDLARIEAAGKGAFAEYAKDGFATCFAVTRREPPAHWAFDVENANMEGRWTGDFAPAPGGCVLTLTEEVTAKKLWMRPFVGMYLKRRRARYLSDLRRALKKG